jgi:hypothetical protein
VQTPTPAGFRLFFGGILWVMPAQFALMPWRCGICLRNCCARSCFIQGAGTFTERARGTYRKKARDPPSQLHPAICAAGSGTCIPLAMRFLQDRLTLSGTTGDSSGVSRAIRCVTFGHRPALDPSAGFPLFPFWGGPGTGYHLRAAYVYASGLSLVHVVLGLGLGVLSLVCYPWTSLIR